MGLLDLFRRKSTSAKAVISMDDESVTCKRPGGLVERVLWNDLQSVIIQTTDRGPVMCDVFWILAGKASGCVVPDEAEGIKLLIEKLQSLPGFNHLAMMQAMGSTENQEFVCWQRDEPKTDSTNC